MLTIRPATATDAPAVVTLALHFLAAPPYNAYLSGSRDGLELFVMFLVEQPKCVVLVAELDGALVGFLAVACGFNPLDLAGRFAEEIAWWVEPGARGAGRIGARLLAAAENWARSIGIAALKMVAPCQSRVGRFYERQGYVALETAYAKGLGDDGRGALLRQAVRAEQGPPQVRPAEHD